LERLTHTAGEARHHQIDRHGQQSGEKRSESEVLTTVTLDSDDLLNGPADEVHPRESGGEGETRDDGVQALGFQFLGNETNGIGKGRHYV